MAIGHLISRNTCFSVAMKRHMRGQSMVELCVAAPVVFFMILVTIQFVLLYRIKATLDYATLQAARAGAVSGADHEKMRDSLER
ncbi:MAG: pilus assembly protein, partial [Pseudomonadales bacterium]|nr:pilus assembly protein [Pseudomonadales bacterium]